MKIPKNGRILLRLDKCFLDTGFLSPKKIIIKIKIEFG
jgi:hypothetical protein